MNKEQFLKDRSPLGMRRKLKLVTLFLARCMGGTATASQTQTAEKWEKAQRTKDLEDDTSYIPNEMGKLLWERIELEMDLTERQQKASSSKRRTLRNLVYGTLAAAAVLVFVFFALPNASHFSNSFARDNWEVITYSAQTGEDGCWHTLPDGTQVRLEPDSKISWNRKAFGRKKRELTMEGEVFFDVAHNAGKPFIIHHGKLETTVRGTSFTIHTDKEENTVTVRNGKVEVRNGHRILATLEINDCLTYHNAEDNAEVSKRQWIDSSAWTRTPLRLDNANMDQLKCKLYRHFLVKVQAEKGLMDGVMFNAYFHAGSKLKDVLNVLCNLYQIDYKISDKDNQIILYKTQL